MSDSSDITFGEFARWLSGFLHGANNMTPEQRSAIRRELSRVASPAPSTVFVPTYVPAAPVPPQPAWFQPSIWCTAAPTCDGFVSVTLGQPVEWACNGASGAV